MIMVMPFFLTSPIGMLVWALDTYLFLATGRLFLGQFAALSTNPYCSAIRQLTDDVPQFVDRWLYRWRRRPSPSWLPWLIVMTAGLVVRQVLALMIARAT